VVAGCWIGSRRRAFLLHPRVEARASSSREGRFRVRSIPGASSRPTATSALTAAGFAGAGSSETEQADRHLDRDALTMRARRRELDRCRCSSRLASASTGCAACKWASQRASTTRSRTTAPARREPSQSLKSQARANVYVPPAPGLARGPRAPFAVPRVAPRMTAQGAGPRLGWYSDARHGVSGLRTRGRRCARAARRSTPRG
jgi:hypothetical protein